MRNHTTNCLNRHHENTRISPNIVSNYDEGIGIKHGLSQHIYDATNTLVQWNNGHCYNFKRFNRSHFKWTINHCGLPGYILFIFLVFISQSKIAFGDYSAEYSKNILRIFNTTACDGFYLKLSCPPMTSIFIQSSMYGRKVPYKELCPRKILSKSLFLKTNKFTNKRPDLNCEAVTSLETVNECYGKRQCRLLVYDRTFGRDPCPTTAKYLNVIYKCSPNDFKQVNFCAGEPMRMRCRHDTVISVYDVTQSEFPTCKFENNTTADNDCRFLNKDVLSSASDACHGRGKCNYNPPTLNCSKTIRLRYFCVPKKILTHKKPSEITEAVTTTTTTVTSEYTSVNNLVTTQYLTSTEATNQVVDITNETSANLTTSTLHTSLQNNFTTSRINSTQLPTTIITETIFPTEFPSDTTGRDYVTSNKSTTDDVITTAHDVVYQATTESLRNKINSAKIFNEFAPPKKSLIVTTSVTMATVNMTTTGAKECLNCTQIIQSSHVMLSQIFGIISYIRDYPDKLLIAALSGVCIALFLTVIALVIPFPGKHRKRTKEVHVQRQPSICSRESINQYRLSQYRTSEDEHENMSLLSAQLQTHTSQYDNQSANQHHENVVTSEEHEDDGRNSVLNTILSKICCTCCCYNAPWQRTGTLKRRMRDRKREIYQVRQRYSSSASEAGDTLNNGGFRQTGQTAGNRHEETDDISSQAVLDNVDGRHLPASTEQQAAVHYNPERRTPSFSSHASYAIHSVENARQSPMTTSPRSGRHDSAYRTTTTGGFPVVSDLQNMQVATFTDTNGGRPVNRSTHRHRQTSTFKKQHSPEVSKAMAADNLRSSQSVTYYPQTSGNEIYPQYTTVPSNYMSAQVDNRIFRHNNAPGGDAVFVQSEPQHHLAMSARTVDLNRKDSSGRPPWMEVRRASIYDNSLPRNNDAYDFYQVPELPGGRNLNYYY